MVGVSDREDDWTGDDAVPADDEAADDMAANGDAGSGRGGDRPRRVSSDRGMSLDAGKLTTYLLWGAIASLAVLAVVAGAGLYTSLSSLIDVWIGDRYQPLARAVLNFAVLCAAAAGIAVLLRRL